MNTRTATIQRLNTGVPGLDEVLGGGVPEFSFNLIAGAHGCGKTTLAHQIMFCLATPERPAVYFTVLGEPPLKMLRYQQQFEFFDVARVGSAVQFVSLADEIADGNLDKALDRINAEVQTRGPSLVFVDSFHSLMVGSRSLGGSPYGMQQFIQQLGMLMTSWQATTFLLGNYFSKKEPNPIFTVTDGVIWLRQKVTRNSVIRTLEVEKMRGQATLAGVHTLRIGPAGIQVFPPAHLTVRKAPEAAPTSAMRLSMGIPALDELMSGGLPRGYSLLVAGPSGSGKSVLAAAFLAEGARGGETGVIVSFEQIPTLARSRTIAELIKKGSVSLMHNQATDLSVDELAATLVAEIRRSRVTRVVIDSLSGFELVVAPAFREDFREALARLVAALDGTGVTVLMTSELEDRYTDLRFSPNGTAFLTDAIVVQRYIEVDSQLQRVMAVVKLRGSSHSTDLRLYEIDADGIQIGQTLPLQEGLLGGRPTQRSRAREGGAGDPSR